MDSVNVQEAKVVHGDERSVCVNLSVVIVANYCFIYFSLVTNIAYFAFVWFRLDIYSIHYMSVYECTRGEKVNTK